MISLLKSAVRSIFQAQEQAAYDPIAIDAVPGLVSVLDECLYREHEHELAKTVCSAHNLFHAWLDIKRQSVQLLEDKPTKDVELLARQALYGACEAIQHLVTESTTANVIADSNTSSNNDGVESGDYICRDTGRQIISIRRKDCWEAKRLYCPDYVWADGSASHSHRILRHLLKNALVVAHKDHSIIQGLDLPIATLILIITRDLPVRIEQFRASIEADTILRRMYLIKMEYRAPFWAFLESHLALQRAPSIDLVQEYMEKSKGDTDSHRRASKAYLDVLLQTPELQELLSLEQKIDEFEKAMSKQLYSFSELARYLDQKRASLHFDILSTEKTQDLRETLRRLKGILCRKQAPDCSTSIRPILLDLQGVPRQEQGMNLFQNASDRLDEFMQQLQCIIENAQLCKNKKKSLFRAETRTELDIPGSIVRGCADFDVELFRCQFQDWMTLVNREHALVTGFDFDELEKQIRRGEMRVTLSQAANQSLSVVLKRLEGFSSDREKRWLLLKQIVEDLSLRELNLQMILICPSKAEELKLNPISSLGIFGQALQNAGEPIPIG